jgi:hypothetical protein
VGVREGLVGLIRGDLLHQLVLHIKHDLSALSEVPYQVVQGVAVRDPTDQPWGTCGGESEREVQRDRE